MNDQSLSAHARLLSPRILQSYTMAFLAPFLGFNGNISLTSVYHFNANFRAQPPTDTIPFHETSLPLSFDSTLL
jgi:hypothetical protein